MRKGVEVSGPAVAVRPDPDTPIRRYGVIRPALT